MKLSLLLPIAIVACMPQRQGCTDADLASIEARYVATVVAACSKYDTPEACPEYPAIRDRFEAERQDYIECR